MGGVLPSSPPTTIRVRPIDPLMDGRWDAYVRADPRASPYHLGAWSSILQRAYRFAPRYLGAELDGELAGVLPLFHGRGLLGSRLTSMPVAWWAGPLGRSREVEGALLRAARELARERGAGKLLVKSTLGGLEDVAPELHASSYDPAWVLELPPDADDLDALWRREKRLWRSLRKAQKSVLTVREATSAAELRRFYSLYLATMRKHRSLPRSYRHLSVARSSLGPDVFRLFVVEHEGEIVAGGLFFAFGKTLELIYNASDEARLDLRPNHLLYEHTIRWAQSRGFGAFDFGGAAAGSSLGDFKAQWGAEPRAVYVYGWAAGGAEAARAERTQTPGGGRVQQLWERTPLWMTRIGGSVAYRYL